ncbi:Hypothetical predicted protein [Mytilus galloprovincialis]|uniref:Carboxylic ester hydrolase n=1 Tax=Mytilus galloprovincialis TaxID=29158 RepID=A0A8B6H2W1_MYTGA|nr:Hypothetical predicted protein [Mytilus galloprovincialis]
MGLLDQSLAIKWIYNNVRRFGGSKHKITLFGQSAGGASVNYHMLSEFTRPYFQKAIIQSVAADTKSTFHSPSVALFTANVFATQLGCNKASVEEKIECLRSLPASVVSAIQISPIPIPPLFIRAHLPTIDKIGFISKSPAELMKQPLPKHISVMLGVVKDEKIYINKGSSDISFKCPVIGVAQALSTVNPDNTVYMYSFEYPALFPPVPQWFGVRHAAENEFIFGTPLIDTINYSDTDRYVSMRMMKYWTTFAKTGNPNFCKDKCNDWNRYDSQDRKYLIIDSDCPQHGQGLRETQCAFLKNALGPVTWGPDPLSSTSFVAMPLTETDAKSRGFQKISDCGAIICFCGRSAALYQHQGEGTDLYIQNGTDPVDDFIKIPHLQSGITTTKWTKGKCFPTMGLHYWYNIRKDMSCDEFYPMFLLYNDGKLNAFGWAFNGDFNSSILEHPPIAALSAFIDPVPDCLLNAETLSTMHIYLTNNPALNKC